MWNSIVSVADHRLFIYFVVLYLMCPSVCIHSPVRILGRMVASIPYVPDHCLFIYFGFCLQGKLINRYKRIRYYPYVMRQTACLVINLTSVDSYASLLKNTTAGWASDSLTASA